MKEALTRYIVEELLGDRAGEVTLAEDDDLLGSGLVNSLGIMSLVLFIEDELGVEVPPEDVTIDNFVSVAAIEAYLTRRRSRP